MADEAVQAVPGQENLTYTLKQYMTYANTLQEKARQLSRAGQSASHDTLDWPHAYEIIFCSDSLTWSAHQVELALWSCHHSTRLGLTPKPSLLGKRGRETELESHEHQPTKKTRSSTSP